MQSRRQHHNLWSLWLTVCLFAAYATPLSAGSCWYVSKQGKAGATGSAWTTALDSLDEALERAKAGDFIFVAAGVYTPKVRQQGQLVPQASFHLKDGVSIVGGFAGYEPPIHMLPDIDNYMYLYDISVPCNVMDYVYLYQSDLRPTYDRDRNGIVEAWEYANETVLTLPAGCEGPVLDSGSVPFKTPTWIDGFTVRGGRATGSNTLSSAPGKGGAAVLNGNIRIAQCLFEDNTALQGGALYTTGNVFVRRSRFIRNNATLAGGALCIAPGQPGAEVRNCVFSDNGDENSCRYGGGAIYIGGHGIINFCTLVGNASSGRGAAILSESSDVSIRNSLIWCNFGHPQEVCCKTDQIHHCAITAGGSYTPMPPDCFPLSHENSGPNGPQFNENTPGLYYPCMQDVPAGNYSLAEGSYLIQQVPVEPLCSNPPPENIRSIPPYIPPTYDARPAMEYFPATIPTDHWPLLAIGAYDTYVNPQYHDNPEGNIAIGLQFRTELYCGEKTEVFISTDPIRKAKYTVTSLNPEVAQAVDGYIHALTPGTAEICLTATPVTDSTAPAATVAETNRILELTVKPRPLTISIDSLQWDTPASPRPRLTWQLASGQLYANDSISGSPECDVTVFPDAPRDCAITPGTLAVSPTEHAKNYRLTFINGTLKCKNSDSSLPSLHDGEMTYDCRPASTSLLIEGQQSGVNCRWSYCDANGQQHEGMPTLPGLYTITATSLNGEEQCSCSLTIHKAVLYCTAIDQYRAQGKANAKLECLWDGFKGTDTPQSLDETPLLTTTALIDSPATPEGYPITVSGGRDHRYEIVTTPARLYVCARTPVALMPPASDTAVYGTPLKAIPLFGYFADAETQEYIPGDLQWNTPDCIPDAGENTVSWLFIPEDSNTYSPLSGTTTVFIEPLPLHIAPVNAAKEYRDSDPDFLFHLTAGSLPGTDTLTCDISREAGEKTGQYRMHISNVHIRNRNSGRDTTANYAITLQDGTMTITRRHIVLTMDSFTVDRNTAVPEFTWRITEGTLLSGDTIQLTARCERILPGKTDDAAESGTAAAADEDAAADTAEETEDETPGLSAGEYLITAEDVHCPDYYQCTVINGLLTVHDPAPHPGHDPATGKLLAPVARPITYGEALNGSTQLSGDIFVHDPTLKREQPITGTFRWSNEGEILNAGEHELEWSFIPDNSNFPVLTGTALLRVERAPLVATFRSLREQYGSIKQPHKLSINKLTGFVNNEKFDANVFYQTQAYVDIPVDSPPGFYPIQIQNVPDSNYYVAPPAEQFEIIKAYPQYSPSSDVRVSGTIRYGDPLHQIVPTVKTIGNMKEEIHGHLRWLNPDETPSFKNDWTSYSSARAIFLPNRFDLYENREFEVNFNMQCAILTITNTEQTRYAGEENPPVELIYRGFKLNEDESVFTELPTVVHNADRNTTPGKYLPRCEKLATLRNYSIDFDFVPMNILPRKAVMAPGTTVQTTNSITYGQRLRNVRLSGEFVDFKTGEKVDGEFRWDTPDIMPPAGQQKAKWYFVPSSKLYEHTEGIADVSVQKKEVGCDLHPREFNTCYGDDFSLPRPHAFYGFENDDTAAVFEPYPYCESKRKNRSPVGDYPVTPGHTTSNNYTLTMFRNTTVRQNPRPATIYVSGLDDHFYTDTTTPPKIIWRAENLLSGDSITGSPAFDDEGGASNYCTVRLGTLDAGPNYTLKMDGKLRYEIEKHKVENGYRFTLTAEYGTTWSKLIEQLPPPPYRTNGGFLYNVEGTYSFPNGYSKEVLPVGTHSINARFSPKDTDNYKYSDFPFTVTIVPRKIDFTLISDCAYGELPPTFFCCGSTTAADAVPIEVSAASESPVCKDDTVVLRFELPEKLEAGTIYLQPSSIEVINRIRSASSPDTPLPYKCTVNNGKGYRINVSPKTIPPRLLDNSDIPRNNSIPLRFTCLPEDTEFNDEPPLHITTSYGMHANPGSDTGYVTLSDNRTGNPNYRWDTSVRMPVKSGLHSIILTGKAELPEAGITRPCVATIRNLTDDTISTVTLRHGMKPYTSIGSAVADLAVNHTLYLDAGTIYDAHRTDNIISGNCNIAGVELLKLEVDDGTVYEFDSDATAVRPTVATRLSIGSSVNSLRLSSLIIGSKNSSGEWQMANSSPLLENTFNYGAENTMRLTMENCELHAKNTARLAHIAELSISSSHFSFAENALTIRSVAQEPEGTPITLNNNSFTAQDETSRYCYIRAEWFKQGDHIDLTGNTFNSITADNDTEAAALAEIFRHLQSDSTSLGPESIFTPIPGQP